MQAIPIRSARIVVLALAGGMLMVSGVFVFLRARGTAPESETGPLLGTVVLVLAPANLASYVFLRRVLVARARTQRSTHAEDLRAGRLPREFVQLTVIGCALAESIGILGALAYFFGASPFLLGAPALALVAILAQFPLAERFEGLLRG